MIIARLSCSHITGPSGMARAKEARNHEGKKDLLNRANEHEKARDHAMQQDPWIDYAEGMLQIAIVFLPASLNFA